MQSCSWFTRNERNGENWPQFVYTSLLLSSSFDFQVTRRPPLRGRRFSIGTIYLTNVYVWWFTHMSRRSYFPEEVIDTCGMVPDHTSLSLSLVRSGTLSRDTYVSGKQRHLCVTSSFHVRCLRLPPTTYTNPYDIWECRHTIACTYACSNVLFTLSSKVSMTSYST